MKNKILTLILLASALCPGCSGWLDVKPYDQISEEELLESEEGFQKLLNGIYIELNSDELYGSTLSVEMIEILGGAYEIGDNSSVWGDYLDLKDYDYNTDYWRGRLNGTWNKAYALILNCNKLLKNIQGRQALFTEHNYDIIRGEALALRAMLHFDMLRLFGPVYSLNPDGTSIPYYADETLTPEALLPASQVVYKVLQDLMAARAALLNDPVITEGTLMSSAGNGSNFLRYRALRLNYYAVSALLARVNLYAGQKQDALTYAVEVIRASNNGIFPFVDRSLVVGNPEDPDRIFSSEVVFALSHAKRSQLFLNYFNPARTTFTFRMESDLISKAIFGGGAESQSDVLANGTSYVNTLRRNRGISTSLEALTPELLKYEYIRELYGEGQLFYLYKRLFSKVIWSYTDSRNPEPSTNLFVVPLPDSETENRE